MTKIKSSRPVEKAEVGFIYQIKPEHDSVFGGCLMITTDPKPWGAQGYFDIPGKGRAYYRCKFENMEHCGVAPLVFDLEATAEENEKCQKVKKYIENMDIENE